MPWTNVHAIELLVVICHHCDPGGDCCCPLTGNARSAYRTACVANNKQLAVAMQMCQRQPGLHAVAQLGNSIGPGWLYQPTAGRAPRPMRTNETKFIEAGLYWPYLRVRRVYNCPLDRTNHISWQSGRSGCPCENGAVCGFRWLRGQSDLQIGCLRSGTYAM